MPRSISSASDIRWPASDYFCGTGNNAGDGYLVAAKLQDRAIDALVVRVGDPQKLGEDASTARNRCAQQAVPIMDWDAFQRDGAGQAMCWLMRCSDLAQLDLPESRLLKPLNG